MGDSERKNFTKGFENLLNEFSDLEQSQIEKVLLNIEALVLILISSTLMQKEDLINISN